MERKNRGTKPGTSRSRSPRILQPARKLPKRARRDRVEAAVRQQGWSHTLALELANETGWSLATIYRDYADLIARLADQEAADLPRRRAAVLNDIRALRVQSQREGAFAPAAKLMGMEVTILGVDRVPLPEVEQPAGPVDTSLEVVLEETRRLRRRAVAGHSYVAAAELLKREQELVAEIRERDEAKAAAERQHLSEDALVAELREAVVRLPDHLQAQLQLLFASKG